jgi:hypothetical protein
MISNLDPKTVIWLLAIVQAAGVASACVARTAAATRASGLIYVLFYGLLGLAGLINVLALAINATFWLVSSFLLALMVLTATVDLGTSRRATAS